MRGGFKDGIGTFLADETFNDRPIKVRFRWSQITPDLGALGAGLLAGRRRDLGDQLGHGFRPRPRLTAPSRQAGGTPAA